MYDGLMQETWWAKPQTTIDMFAIKKHMEENPVMKNKSLVNLSHKDFDAIENIEWADCIRNKRPQSSSKQKQ